MKNISFNFLIKKKSIFNYNFNHINLNNKKNYNNKFRFFKFLL